MPTDQCRPIQTYRERSLFFTLYQDLACKTRDGSDNFLVMAGRFNMEYRLQVRHVVSQLLIAGSPVLAMQNKEPRMPANYLYPTLKQINTDEHFLNLYHNMSCMLTDTVSSCGAHPLPGKAMDEDHTE